MSNVPVRSRYTELLIDGIVGAGFGGSVAFAQAATLEGYATFTGNQHNPEWQWRRSRLEQLDQDQLLGIYIEAKGGKV